MLDVHSNVDTWVSILQIGVTTEMHYDDAFTLQEVVNSDVVNFNYFAGMVPFLQKLIHDVRTLAPSCEPNDALRLRIQT